MISGKYLTLSVDDTWVSEGVVPAVRADCDLFSYRTEAWEGYLCSGTVYRHFMRPYVTDTTIPGHVMHGHLPCPVSLGICFAHHRLSQSYAFPTCMMVTMSPLKLS